MLPFILLLPAVPFLYNFEVFHLLFLNTSGRAAFLSLLSTIPFLRLPSSPSSSNNTYFKLSELLSFLSPKARFYLVNNTLFFLKGFEDSIILLLRFLSLLHYRRTQAVDKYIVSGLRQLLKGSYNIFQVAISS